LRSDQLKTVFLKCIAEKLIPSLLFYEKQTEHSENFGMDAVDFDWIACKLIEANGEHLSSNVVEAIKEYS